MSSSNLNNHFRRQTQQEMTYRYRSPFSSSSSSYLPGTRWLDDLDFDRPFFNRSYWNDRNLRDSHRIADGVGDPVCGKDYFSIQIDVGNFRPEELKVTVIENQVVIEGKHDEKSDNFGQVERYFVRKYNIPEGVKSEDVVSELSRDGILTVQTIKKPPVDDSKTRTIPIQPRYA